MSKKIALTGDRPTGKLHLGHYAGSLKTRLALQGKYEQFVMIADTEALTHNAERASHIRENTFEVLCDYLAVGLDPKKTTIFLRSQIPELFELTGYFLNLVTLSRAEQNPTVKTEMREKGFSRNVPLGFLTYPVSQSADILLFRADVVPVGEDQFPMVEQANEIAEKFNRIYGQVLKKAKPLRSATGRLSGIDGKSKMSKSLGNAIFLSDSPEEVRRKVMLMYTDPEHIRVSDRGHVKGNVVFEYLDAFDPKRSEVAKLKAQYQKGGLGDVVLKHRLIGVLEELLAPMRVRRAKAAKNRAKTLDILARGTRRARAAAESTMRGVRKAMHLDYNW